MRNQEETAQRAFRKYNLNKKMGFSNQKQQKL